MDITTGPPVTGEKFYGRKKELQRMYSILTKTNASMFIPGPRRIGKSSLVKEFIERYQNDYKFLYFNIQSKHSVMELCEDLFDELHEKFPEIVKSRSKIKDNLNSISEMIKKVKIANIIDIETGRLTKDVKELMNKMEDVLEDVTNENVIIAMDEFSDFLLHLKRIGLEEVVYFLEWLRDLRQNEKIRLIITGSINIISTVTEMNVIDLINDLTDIEIYPLSDNEITDLLSQLLQSHNITLSKPCMQYSTKKLQDGIPSYIQLFADGITKYVDNDSTIKKINDIKNLYKKITKKTHKEFEDFHSRLNEYLDTNEYEAAKKILAHLSDCPLSFEDLFPYVEPLINERKNLHRILKRLTDELYLEKKDNMYNFVSPMLKDWWDNSYGWEKKS